MAASVLTLFLSNPIQSGSSAGLLTLTQPATSTSTTGWTVAKNAAATYSRQSYNVENTVFSSTVQPATGPATGHLAEDCYRTSAVTTGVFSAGTWYSGISCIAVTAASTGSFHGRYRVWRSVNADGSLPNEITKGAMSATTIGNLLTTVAQTSSASTQVTSFSLGNEYLFFQVAWEIGVASGSNSADCLIRQGAITSNVAGSFLATSAFSATGAASTAKGPGYYHHHYYRGLVEGQV